ncbi:transmembrane channel-like protein isoform X1 [Tribolium castaneum]|nr:PREDICTED: transmembrane channel-like protein 3 isoform X3 [Tribolium castaneum]|eukprot:XP_015833695.1 PREDICTED: transmembrane channel-like protein 3 isoform X3 [Tribolium castaneum]
MSSRSCNLICCQNVELECCEMDVNIKETEKIKRETPTGILRTESGKSRRASVEFKFLKQGEPTSPQPSVDRFSVTFAEDSVKSDSSKCNYYSPRVGRMDKVHFPQGTVDIDDSDEEDYSASVNAIIQRRASTRKSRRRSSRRASSPFSPDILLSNEGGRRRSSVFTTSSGDTAITMDEGMEAVSQEEIFENIKLHKEVLSNVKMQPWNMRKKLKLVVQAKAYIKQHEGALQERLAQSRSTRDMLARWNIYLIKKWQHYRRELANLSNWLVPWERKIKEIESHFGSVVASYFLFLRWLFWVNVVLGIVLISFVAVPEMLTAVPDARKQILKEERYNSTNFQTLWDFGGVFKYSPLFYGWYTYKESKKSGYRMPFAYFITGLVAYAYSFFATLRKMAENSRMSKLSEKDDECIFSWKLFTAWDYMIGNAETAHNRIASIVVGFKEALLEEAEKKREARNWKITGFRILVNTVVLGLLFFSAFAVILVVKRSTEPEARSSVWRSNEITFVMTFISISFPMIFEGLGFLEQYHPRKQLRLQLARIMVLNLLNLYSLIFALFDKINDMTPELESFKRNLTRNNTSVLAYSAGMQCYNSCNSETDTLKAFNLIAAVATNVSFTMYPVMQKAVKNATTEPDKETIDAEFTTGMYTNPMDFLDNYTTELPGNFSSDDSTTFKISTNLPDFVTNSLSTSDGTEESTSASADLILSTATINETSADKPKLQGSAVKKRNCLEICENFTVTPSPIIDESSLNYTTRRRLRNLCWETNFGQELIKLTVMDLVMTILSTLAMDFIRGIFVRFMNRCWCWDLEKVFPQYGDFKVAENILHLVNNQGMVWMGMFFSPGLVVLNIFKLFVLMYFRTWIVLTCNVPHEIIFRASRSNNFYYALLLMMLFLCVLPVGYAIVQIPPSWNCGPFSNYQRIFHILTKTIKRNVPQIVERVLDYIASPAIVIPILLLLVLIIYYLVSLTSALREANNDLKFQLRRERTEERRKMFQIADRRRKGKSGGSGEFSNTPFAKWRKLMSTMPSTGKSFDDTSPRQETNESHQNKEDKVEIGKNKDFFSKFIKKALGKTSSISENENRENENLDEGTDTEQHESLPEDLVSIKDSKPQPPSRLSISSNSFDYQKGLLQKQSSLKSVSESSNKYNPVRDIGSVQQKKQLRQDSSSSNWSDNIPVITISKTESAEFLDVVPEAEKAPVTEKEIVKETAPEAANEFRFKPKIKCALKKQSAEIDEEVIRYFSKDLELKPEPDAGPPSESSEDTARDSSLDTVLAVKSEESAEERTDAPKANPEVASPNESTTESSAEYNENMTSL